MKTFLRKSGILAIVFVMANVFFSSAAFGQVRVTTDKDDYAPGEIAIVTGSGWTGDTLVDLHFEEDPFVDDIHDYHDIIVNSNGTFRVEFPILDRHLGVAFTLTAEGKQTGRTAVHVFTDANVKFEASGLPAGISVSVTASYTNESATTVSNQSVGPFVTPSASNTIAVLKNTTVTYTFSNVPGYSAPPANSTFTVPDNNGARTITGIYTATSTTNLVAGSATGTYNGTTNLTATLTSGSPATSVSSKTITFSLNGTSVGTAVTNASGIATLNNASLSGINAGSYPTGVSARFTADAAYSGSTGANNLTVNKATPTATLAVSNSPQIYTGSGQSATVSISVSSVVGAVSNILTGGAATQTNAATYAVTANFVPTDTANYNSLLALAAGNFVIGKATPTATLAVSNSPQIYTGSGQSATVSISVSSVPGAVSNILTGGLATQTNAATYAITANFVPTDTANYNSLLALAVGNFVIGKAAPTATLAVSNTPQTYTSSGQAATVTISVSSVPGAVSNILTGGAASQTNVAAYAVTANFVPTDTANYNSLLALSAGNFAITQKAASVVVDLDQTKVYGSSDPTFTGVLTGFMPADNVTASYLRVSGETVGDYEITATLAPAGVLSNYNITNIPADFAITTAALTVTASAGQTKIYGASDPTLTYTITGFVNGDVEADLDTLVSIARAAGEDVGNYTITPSAALDANYTVAFITLNFAITKADLTVVNTDRSKVYGVVLTNADYAGSFTGVVAGDNITLTRASTGDPANATVVALGPTYPIVGTLADPDSRLGNYEVLNPNGVLTVTKASITVVNTSRSKVYGVALTNADYAGSITGLAAGDVITVTRASAGDAATATVAGSTYPIVGTLVDAANRAANYELSNPNGLLTINRAPLTLVNTSRLKVYGVTLTNADYAGSISGLVADDVITVTRASTGDAATATVAGSTYPIVGTLVDLGSRLTNYELSNPNGVLTVTKASITVVNTSRSKVYGVTLTNAYYAGSFTGVVAGDNITLTRASTGDPANATVVAPGPTYPIVGTLADPDSRLGNYEVSNPNGVLTITKASITVVNTDRLKVYGVTLTNADYAGSSTGIQAGDNITITRASTGGVADATVAGSTYPIVGTLVDPNGRLANYNVTNPNGVLTITKASITVVNTDRLKVYGVVLTNADYAGSITGNLASDYITITRASTGGVANATVVAPGPTYPIIGTLADPNGRLANYNVTNPNGVLTLTAAPVNSLVSVNIASVQYSDQVTFTATITGGAPLLTGGPQAAQSVTFRVGAQVMNTTPVSFVNNGNDIVATGTYAMVEGIPSQMAQGSKIVTAVINSANANFAISSLNPTTLLTITREDAVPIYTGSSFVSTASATSNTATVILSATIKDMTAVDSGIDPNSGDIRNARVRFVNRDLAPTAISSATSATGYYISEWLTVGLVSSGDTKTGTVTANWTASIGSSDAQQFTIGVIIDDNGYYFRNNSDDNEVINVSKPLNDLVTGGGFIIMSKAIGGINPQQGKKNNFGFNIKRTKSGGLQGNINAIVRSLDGKTYQVKGNVMSSLSVSPATANSPAKAVFNGKANIQNITDPLNVISVDGNATLQVTMTDRGEPGKNDDMSIIVWDKNSNVWYSSNWDGTRTAQQLLDGGNIKIHSTGSFATGTANSSVSLISSLNPSTVGQSVTFTATVTGNLTTKPTGIVNFVDVMTNTVLGSIAVNATTGIASVSVVSLSAGLHSITAYYGGDSKYTVSSNSLTQNVNVNGAQNVRTSAPVIVKQEKALAVIEEAVPFNVIAYPNPAQYQFTLVVEGGSKEKADVVLYDVLGRKVKHIEISDGQPIRFGEELPTGAYFTIVSQGANQKTVRLIKQ